MPNTITNRQMAFILVLTLSASAVVYLPSLLAQDAGSGSWLTIMVASVPFACAAWVWAKLNTLFPGKVITDYSADLLGKAAAMIISAAFLLYFFTILTSQYVFVADMLKTNFLPETPQWATVLATIPVIGFVAYKGVTNVARLIEIFGVIFLMVAVSIHIIMFFSGDLYHILPLFNPAETGRYLSAVFNMIYPMLGFEVLAVLPFTEKYAPKAGKVIVLTVLLIGVFYVLIVESCFTLVSIDEIVHYNFPLIVAIRQVELPMLKVFQRPDILYLTVGFLGLFGGTSVTYLCVLELFCRLLPKVRRSIATAAIGAAIFAAFSATYTIKNIGGLMNLIISYFGLMAAVFVPVVLLIIAKVKKRERKKMV